MTGGVRSKLQVIILNMAYRDNASKVAVVVNRAVGVGRLANAVAHCCVGLAEKIGGDASFLDYHCPAAGWTSRMSKWPVIVLAAKNSGQLSRLASEAAQESLPFNCFTAAMIGESAEEQIKQTREDAQPEYWVVAVFGAAETLRPLTKRFSLFDANRSG